MKTLVHIFLLISSMLLGLTPSARGQEGSTSPSTLPPIRSVFSVRDIPVDVSAASAVAARNQAISLAHRLAFEQVFRKLVAVEDWSLQPALTNSELADLVTALDVTGEKSSQTRYFASLSVLFDRDAILDLFMRLGVTYTDSETPPIILLPVADYAGLRLLWSPDNVWASAWQSSATRAQSLVNYVQLAPTPVYTSQVSALGIADAQPENLISLIRSEGASDIVIAYAQVSFDLARGRYVGRFDIRRGPQQSQFMSFELAQTPEQTPQQMLEQAIASIDLELSALWKRQLLVEYAQAEDVTIIATFETPEDWRRILRAVSSARRLRNIAVGKLALYQADITARFFGDFKPLAENLATDGVILEQESPGTWRASAMSQEQRAAMQIEVFSSVVDGYVDPFEDGMAASSDSADMAPTDFEKAPWEMGTPNTSLSTGPSSGPSTDSANGLSGSIEAPNAQQRAAFQP